MPGRGKRSFIELASPEEAEGCLEHINGANWEYSVITAQVSEPRQDLSAGIYTINFSSAGSITF